MQLAEQFDRAAGRYDVLTRLNPGYHAALRHAVTALVARLRDAPRPLRLWDLGCGSGLSTRALTDAAGPECTVIGVDASGGMLAQAKAKDWPPGVGFVQAQAQDLRRVAADGAEEPADGAFAAYLMRNVPEGERAATLATIHEHVRPGGWVALQDYHVKGDILASTVWTLVCWGVVMPLAVALRAHPAIYHYLWRSVLDNDSTAELSTRLERAGFTDQTWSTARGWQRGILHTVLARRPHGPADRPGTRSPDRPDARPTT